MTPHSTHSRKATLIILSAWLAPFGFTLLLLVGLGRYWAAHDEGINAFANDGFLIFILAPIMLVVFSLVDVGAHILASRVLKRRGLQRLAVALSAMGVVFLLCFALER